MSRMGSIRIRGFRRGWGALASAVLVTSSLAGGTAWGAPPEATKLAITAVNDQGTGLPVAIEDQPFRVGVELRDQAGTLVTTTKDVAITLDVSEGTLSGNTTGTIPKNQSSTMISGVVYPETANVTLFASARKIETGEWFLSVQKTAVAFEASPAAFTVSTCGPGDPSPANPKCIVAEFHNGAPDGYAAHGTCLAYPGVQEGTCPTSDAVADVSLISLISDLQGLYTRTDPLAVSWFCDVSACPRGTGSPSSGNPFTTLFVEVDGTFAPSPPCPSKGTIGSDQKFCTDYVASTGLPGGDLMLVILFDGDPRWI